MRTPMGRHSLSALMLLILLLCLPLAAAAAQGRTQSVSPKQVRSYLEHYLQGQKGRLPGVQLRLKSIQLPEPFAVPAGRLTAEVKPGNPRLLGSRSFTLILRVNGEVVENRRVRAELEALAPVVIAAADLRRGTVLSEQNLSTVVRDITRVRESFPAAEPLMGKKLKRTVRSGTPIVRAMIDFPKVIKRGEMVTITARRGGLVLTARGVARENGDVGETIKVRNTASRKEIFCQVVAPGEVSVEF